MSVMKMLFRRLIPGFLFIAGWFLLFGPARALAYRTDPLPAGNLIANPWFRSLADPNTAGSDGWVFVPTVNEATWSLNQHGSNPSPMVQVSENCGSLKVYCGTAARWTPTTRNGITQSYPGVDAYIYQVVAADPGHRRLEYFMHWVNLRIEIFDVSIYSGTGPDGPWNPVWQVISISQDQNRPAGQIPGSQGIPWFTTGIRDTVLAEGHPYYKVELHARYPITEAVQGDVGVMVTGIYFATGFTEESERLSTPDVVLNPTVMPPGSGAGQSPNAPSTTTGLEPETGLATSEATAFSAPADEPREGGLDGDFLLGLLTGVLIIGVFLIIRTVSARSR